MDEITNTIMKERNFKLLEFISNEGRKFKSNYDKLFKSMRLPANAKVKGDISDKLREAYENRRLNAIPAFFKTMLYLKKRKRDFSIIFRTHGRELNTLIEEFNNFCEGNHPAFNGESGTHQVKFNGTKLNARDMRIKSKQTGMYFRFGPELSDVNLLLNTLDRVQCENTDQLIEHYGGQIEEGTVSLHNESIEEDYMIIMNTLKNHGSMAIQDDFWAYSLSNLNSDFGKLLLIDQNDFSVQHIFFDDLAVEGDNCNIDVRDISSGEKLPDKKFRDKYVVRADIYDAILEHDYFIKHIDACEKARNEEIERYQQGVLSSDEEETYRKEDEWEKLQKLPNEEYLMRTVAPILYQGLNLIATERPQNPIEFLSLYMLQNQDLVKLPKPSSSVKS